MIRLMLMLYAVFAPVQYDPLGLALEGVQLSGFTIPQGYTVLEAPRGSLPHGASGFTDHEAKTISIDVNQLLGQGGTPAASGVLLEVVLRHEFGHTDEYGYSARGGPGASDLCKHSSLYGDTIDDLCTEIGTLPSSERGGACKVSNTFVRAYNSNISSCSGPQTKKFGCGACDE